jgi:hypothetical protein
VNERVSIAQELIQGSAFLLFIFFFFVVSFVERGACIIAPTAISGGSLKLVLGGRERRLQEGLHFIPGFCRLLGVGLSCGLARHELPPQACDLLSFPPRAALGCTQRPVGPGPPILVSCQLSSQSFALVLRGKNKYGHDMNKL